MTVTRTYMMLMVEDMDRAVRFYRDAFGLEPAVHSPGWSELPVGSGAVVALHKGREGGESDTGLGFHVDDIEGACRAAESAGGRVVSPPQARAEEGGMKLATVADTEGNHVFLAQD